MTGLPNVSISLVRDGLGLVAETNDNTVAMILPGVAVVGKIALNEPKAIYSTDGANELGINATSNADAYRHITEFYAIAGTGAKLWIMLVAATTKLSAMVDSTLEVCPAKLILNAANGEIAALGIAASTDGGATVDGLDSEVKTARTKGQVLAMDYLAKIMPFVLVVEGRKMTDADALANLHEETNYRTGTALYSSKNDQSASVGSVLGQLAAIAVQRKNFACKERFYTCYHSLPE